MLNPTQSICCQDQLAQCNNSSISRHFRMQTDANRRRTSSHAVCNAYQTSK